MVLKRPRRRRAPAKRKTKRKPSAYNRHVAREMKKGKSMKAAARTWKGTTRRRVGKPKRRTTTTRRSKVKMGRRGGFNQAKLFKLVRLGALGLPAAVTVMSTQSNEQKMKQLSLDYFGVNPDDGSFKLSRLSKGWMPFVAANLVTYGIPKLNGLLRGL